MKDFNPLERAIENNKDYIMREIRAVSIKKKDEIEKDLSKENGWYYHETNIDNIPIKIWIKKV